MILNREYAYIKIENLDFPKEDNIVKTTGVEEVQIRYTIQMFMAYWPDHDLNYDVPLGLDNNGLDEFSATAIWDLNKLPSLAAVVDQINTDLNKLKLEYGFRRDVDLVMYGGMASPQFSDSFNQVFVDPESKRLTAQFIPNYPPLIVKNATDDVIVPTRFKITIETLPQLKDVMLDKLLCKYLGTEYGPHGFELELDTDFTKFFFRNINNYTRYNSTLYPWGKTEAPEFNISQLLVRAPLQCRPYLDDYLYIRTNCESPMLNFDGTKSDAFAIMSRDQLADPDSQSHFIGPQSNYTKVSIGSLRSLTIKFTAQDGSLISTIPDRPYTLKVSIAFDLAQV